MVEVCHQSNRPKGGFCLSTRIIQHIQRGSLGKPWQTYMIPTWIYMAYRCIYQVWTGLAPRYEPEFSLLRDPFGEVVGAVEC